jgi:type II secretory pathway pseudopilin PulG
VETLVAPKVAPEMKTRKEQVSLSSEVKAVKKAVEPRGWHPKVKIGFTLIALGVILVVLGLGFVGGLSAFIGLLFTIVGLLHTY